MPHACASSRLLQTVVSRICPWETVYAPHRATREVPLPLRRINPLFPDRTFAIIFPTSPPHQSTAGSAQPSPLAVP
jgi:hypothetical protein